MENETRYWFKRKRYGWGWTPATWEGWVTTLIFLALVLGNAIRTIHAPTVVPFVLQTIVASLLFLFVTMKKGESPRWQWGEETKE